MECSPSKSSLIIEPIWIQLPFLPPSANEMYETNVIRVNKIGKNGKPYQGFKTSKRKAEILTTFQIKSASFKNKHFNEVQKIRPEIMNWVGQGYMLRVDTWFAFERGRIWTKDRNPQSLDADNRRKPMQDALASILGIDDKWFFSGNVEKVTCIEKESECSIIRIVPVKARTLADIKNLMNQTDSTLRF